MSCYVCLLYVCCVCRTVRMLSCARGRAAAKKQLEIPRKTLDVATLAIYFFKIKGFSEIIAGEIIVKSPYEVSPRARAWTRTRARLHAKSTSKIVDIHVMPNL